MSISGRSFAQSAWVLMVVFLACSFKTYSHNITHKYCTPSSCGNIPNISYPFRLNHDPETCGESGFTLLCENNITVLDLPSLKYHVQAINYHSRSIRVVDPGFQKYNCSSVPIYSAYDFFSSVSPYFPSLTMSFIKCSKPVNNSLYVDIAACNDTSTSSTGTSSSLSQPKTYGYMVGGITSEELEEGCSLEWMTFATETRGFSEAGDYVVLFPKDINELLYSLAYGFELEYWLDKTSCQGSWKVNDECFPHTVAGGFQFLWILQFVSSWTSLV